MGEPDTLAGPKTRNKSAWSTSSALSPDASKPETYQRGSKQVHNIGFGAGPQVLGKS